MASLSADKELLGALESGDLQTALRLLPKDGPPIVIGPEGFSPLHYACKHGEAEVTRVLITQYKYSHKSTSKHDQTPAHVAAKYGHVETLKVLVGTAALCDYGDLNTADISTSTTSVITSVRDEEGNTPLHTAAACGQLPVVQYFIRELQCSPTSTNLNKETLLHLAAENGHLDVVKYLVDEASSPLSPVDEHGRTPVYVAAGHGQLEVVRYLIEGKGCDPNTRTTEQWKTSKFNIGRGRTLLHTASREGHLNVVHYLVNELKCDPSCRDEDGATSLHLASQEGHLEIVKFLVCECQCDPTVAMNNGFTPLHQASKNERIAVVQFLVDKGCDPHTRDKLGDTPVHYAAFRGRLNVLKFFITKKECDPMLRGQWGRTPLHNASDKGHLDTVAYLINEHQVDPSCQDEKETTPLHLSSMNGHLAVVQFLVEKGCDPLTRNKNGNTPVHSAALNGRLNVLQFFITEKGCDPIVRGQLGRTPLHSASEEGHLDTVKYLINEHQVDPSCQDEKESTPLHLSSMNGHLALVQFLVEKCCNPLAKDKNGDTPVHSAALKGRLNVLELFITEKGCDPMVRGQFGRTPLHLSSEKGHLETVKYLINEHQVDPSCQDEKENTPLHCDHLAKDNNGDTPVHDAARNGRLNVLEFFITEKGCDPMVSGRWHMSPLHCASQNGQLDTVKYLINEHQVDPSCQDQDEDTPLHLSSMNGHLAVVQFLVEKGCDPLTRNKNGNTPVHSAALNGRLNVLEFFIEKGCDPVVRGQFGMTPLHLSSVKGHLETVKYLINAHQVDPSCKDQDEDTPLHLSSMNGHLALVQFLVEKGCDPLAKDNNGDTPVHDAARNGRLNVLEFFITEKGCDPMVSGRWHMSPLHRASQNGQLDTVKYLINEHQVDPSCQDQDEDTPLHLSSQNGHLAVVQFLVEKGCDPLTRNKNGNTPVHSAALNGRLNVLEFFIEKGMVRGSLHMYLHSAILNGQLDTVKYLINEHQVDPSCQDQDEDTPLHFSSSIGHLALVQFLVEKGCDPLTRNKNGNTPVHSAALNGRLNVLQFFITEKGCDPVVKGWNGRTPLHCASQEGHLATVKYLINEHQVDPSCQDEDESTPLHLSSMYGHLAVVRFLVEKGCDHLAEDKYGATPVHDAARNGSLNELEFFITKKGCDPTVRGQFGRTPLHYASETGQLEIIKYLVDQQVDLATRSDGGSTPMTLACKHYRSDVVLYLYSKGEPLPNWYANSKPLLGCCVKIYIIGNQSIGKSTLMKALSAESMWFGSIRNVSGVASATAGIVPVEFESSLYGKVTFYDFAGHKEYYAGHEIIFDTSSHPVVLLLVNVSEKYTDTCKAVNFWKQFLTSSVSVSGCQAHVILVGSHADLVHSRDLTTQGSLLNNFQSSSDLTVVGSVLLDCRKSSSAGMSELRQILTTTCKKVRLKAEFDYQKGGILSEFISKSLPDVQALTFIELFSSVLNSPEPHMDQLKDVTILYQACESLNISGHYLVLRNEDVQEETWIILKKELILSQVHGLLKHLKQYTQLGIVSMSLLKRVLQKHAPDLPPDLVVRYMKKMVFFSEVEPDALTLIRNFPPKSMDTKEKYLLFSSLISTEKPNHVWACEQLFTYASGWHLKCAHPKHFFTPRFHQTLLIELACRFALRPSHSSPTLLEPYQGCSIWKNGIRWLDPRGIEVMAQVEEDGKSLTLMLRCLDESKTQCSHLRSDLIMHLLSIKRKVCKRNETEEYLIHPKCLDGHSPPEHSLIPVSVVAVALLQRDHKIVLNEALSKLQGRPFLSTEDLLYFEPYEGIGVNLLQALTDPQNQHKVIEQSMFEDLAEALNVQWENTAVVLHTRQAVVTELRSNDSVGDVKKCMEIFTRWSTAEGTYSALQHDLGQYSIFRGRNLLELCPDYLARSWKQTHQTSEMSTNEIQEQEAVHGISQHTHVKAPPTFAETTLSSVTVGTSVSDPLTLNDFRDVQNKLWTVRSKWFNLGIELGLYLDDLEVIRRDHRYIDEQFPRMIKMWLEKREPKPTWQAIIAALQECTVDEEGLADDLTKAHQSNT